MIRFISDMIVFQLCPKYNPKMSRSFGGNVSSSHWLFDVAIVIKGLL